MRWTLPPIRRRGWAGRRGGACGGRWIRRKPERIDPAHALRLGLGLQVQVGSLRGGVVGRLAAATKVHLDGETARQMGRQIDGGAAQVVDVEGGAPLAEGLVASQPMVLENKPPRKPR